MESESPRTKKNCPTRALLKKRKRTRSFVSRAMLMLLQKIKRAATIPATIYSHERMNKSPGRKMRAAPVTLKIMCDHVIAPKKKTTATRENQAIGCQISARPGVVMAVKNACHAPSERSPVIRMRKIPSVSRPVNFIRARILYCFFFPLPIARKRFPLGLDPVIFLVPFDKILNSLVDARCRLPAHLAQFFDICDGRNHVAWRQGHHFHFCFLADIFFYFPDKLYERILPIAADIHHRIGKIGIERRNGTGSDIIDIGEIPRHLSVIIDQNRLAREDILRKKEERHIGPPPRPIHREITQSRRGKLIDMAVDMGQELIRLFGRGVW